MIKFEIKKNYANTVGIYFFPWSFKQKPWKYPYITNNLKWWGIGIRLFSKILIFTFVRKA